MSKQKIIIAFIIMTFVLSLAILISDASFAKALSRASPAIAAFLLVICSKQKIKEFKALGLFHLGKIYWYLIAILLPTGVIAISYLIATFLGYFSLDLTMPWPVLIYRLFMITFTWPLVWAMLEEIGWRGFLQPKLTTAFSLLQGIFFTGLIWACWHYVFIFSGNYYEAGNLFLNTPLFTVTILLMSFAIGWIRWKSQSLWPCIVFHSASNAAWEICSSRFTITNPNYIYISGEAGILNIVLWGIVLLIIWKKLDGERNV